MPQAFTLSNEQRATFERDGVLRLPGFYPTEVVARMADAIWRDLAKRFGAEPGRPETWTVAQPRHFQALSRSGAFEGLDTPALTTLGDGLLGEGQWNRARHWAQPLVTLPSATWDSPGPIWHFDGPAEEQAGPLAAVRLFVMVEAVAPLSGGTLYVEGAHRLALALAARRGRLRSAEVREHLRLGQPWFADLFAERGSDMAALLARRGRVDDVAVAVREMTGEGGDLIAMHPNMLHAGAFNGSVRPRLMLTETLYRA